MGIPYARTATAVVILITIGCLCGYCYVAGQQSERAVWEAKWNAESSRLAVVRAEAESSARKEEQRRQREMESVIDDAQKKIARAEADAAAAGVESVQLREQARRLAARAGQCPGNPPAAQGGKANYNPAVVLAELLSRADERAGELAAAYDRARASGMACERAYDSLRTATTKPRQ